MVTRPTHQAENLCHLISTAGGVPIRLPTLEIEEIADKTPLLYCRPQDFDLAIFISVNAVEKSLPWLSLPLPTSLQLLAVGKHTAEALAKWNLKVQLPAPPYNSEALLAMPELQPQAILGKKLLIFRGAGGRELLADTLRQRGAQVEYLTVYRRVQPLISELITQPVDIITITSGDALQNLLVMLEGQTWLPQTPLVVISERVMTAARNLGITAPIYIAPMASDESLLQALFQASNEINQSV
jgi:uroporphyrinogen-III synthase